MIAAASFPKSMAKLLLVPALVLTAAAAGAGAPVHQTTTTSCGSDSSEVVNFDGSLRAFLSRSDSVNLKIRNMFHLPLSTGTLPAVVSDTIVCRSIRRAIDSLSGAWGDSTRLQPDSMRSIHVFSVDTRYVVADVTLTTSMHRGIDGWQVFTRDFRRLGVWY